MARSEVLPRGKRVLVAASTGGHLLQARMLGQLLGLAPDSLWVTFANEQSRHLLKDEPHEFLPYIPPRGLREAAAAYRPLRDLMRSGHFDAAISTGAAIAVPAALAARRTGTPFYYVESISRIDGPSVAGRVVARLPWVNTSTQHAHWSTPRWKHDISVLDGLATVDVRRGGRSPDRKTKIFVSLGTIRPYRFDRLVDAVLAVHDPAKHEVVWQLGVTTRDDLPGRVEEWLSGGEMLSLFDWCDVLVSHAGVGTALQALNQGVNTLLVPRRARHGEHVDDHQEQIARLLAARGLARVREADSLAPTDLEV
jgi:UDP-N-acetylglucosamine--N-acetylmuramyl-(pentapeptide) pyrophosphoryl-undecaprenol N-acetylglucosamine transferase